MAGERPGAATPGTRGAILEAPIRARRGQKTRTFLPKAAIRARDPRRLRARLRPMPYYVPAGCLRSPAGRALGFAPSHEIAGVCGSGGSGEGALRVVPEDGRIDPVAPGPPLEDPAFPDRPTGLIPALIPPRAVQDVQVTVVPSTVRQGDEITVAVSSREPIDDWLLRICESGGEVRSRPTRLSVYGAPASDGDSATLECKIRTIGYEPGEYMVDVSPDDEFALERTKTRRLVVEAAEPKVIPRSGAWYLAPIFLGLIGGIVAYVVLRQDNPRMATNCVIIGLVITVLLFLITLPFSFAHPAPALTP